MISERLQRGWHDALPLVKQALQEHLSSRGTSHAPEIDEWVYGEPSLAAYWGNPATGGNSWGRSLSFLLVEEGEHWRIRLWTARWHDDLPTNRRYIADDPMVESKPVRVDEGAPERLLEAVKAHLMLAIDRLERAPSTDELDARALAAWTTQESHKEQAGTERDGRGISFPARHAGPESRSDATVSRPLKPSVLLIFGSRAAAAGLILALLLWQLASLKQNLSQETAGVAELRNELKQAADHIGSLQQEVAGLRSGTTGPRRGTGSFVFYIGDDDCDSLRAQANREDLFRTMANIPDLKKFAERHRSQPGVLEDLVNVICPTEKH